MKEEPSQAIVLGFVNDDGGDGEEFMEIPAKEKAVEVEIKHMLPPITDVLVTNPLEIEPDNGINSEVEFSTDPLSYYNEDDEEQAELDEIEAIINEGELDVKDVRPVAIPIPISRTTVGGHSNDIVITYNKPKREGTQVKPKPCVCTICHTGFPSQQLFQLHMSNVHSDTRPYPCSHCGKRFASSEQVKVHETIHDPNRFKGEPMFPCDLCDKKYHLKRSLNGHRRILHFGYKKPQRPKNKIITEHHSVGVRNHRLPKKDDKVFKCPHCDLKFAMRCMVQKHLRCHTREKPYQCKECEQRFVSSSSLRGHMKYRHMNPSTNPRPMRPQFMYKQPCPCEVCGKVFNIPSRLKKHMTMHTGEMPHECSSCGKRFRLKQNLVKHYKRHVAKGGGINNTETFKCRICGKDGFLVFSDIRNHRTHVHRHIPHDTEKEKPFGCGICGKPYYQRGQAMVCALLKHDPTSLYAAMFRHKCPECPPERFGYHSTLAVRRHWETEHTDMPLPVHYRAFTGMYEEDTNGREDSLPSVSVNKELAKSIKENGPTAEYEFPLYTEFDLLPIEKPFYRDFIKGKKRKPRLRQAESGPFTCEICEKTIFYKRNFTRHVKLHEKDHLKRPNQGAYNCTICEKGFRKLKTLRSHEKLHIKHNISGTDDQANFRQGAYSCGICDKRFRKVKTLRLHEKLHQNHKLNDDGSIAMRRPRGRPPISKEAAASPAVKRKGKVGRPRKLPLKHPDVTLTEPESISDPCFRVNFNDAAAVKSVLGNRRLSINVSRVENYSQRTGNGKEMHRGVRVPLNSKAATNCESISNKVLKIVLRRVDD